jgi:foldase protein PrsA
MKKALRILMIFAAAALGVLLGIFIYKKTNIKEYALQLKNNEISNDVVVTVAGETITFTEARAYLAATQNRIESIYGSDVWDYVIDEEGTTYGEELKDSALEKLIYLKLVCANAEQYGVSIDSADRININQYTSDFFEGISESTADDYDLTEDVVKQIYTDNILAKKVYDKITLNAETDADEENCRQADFYVIEIYKYYTDESGENIYYTGDELETAKKKAEDAFTAAANESFQSVAMRYSDNSETELTCGGEDLPLAAADKVMALSSGQYTDIIETTDSYIIYYCINSNNEEATKQAVQDKTVEQQKECFSNLYTVWRENADIEINEELWNKL